MKLAVVNKEGQETGRQAELDDAVFGIEPNTHLLYQDTRLLQARKRQGTHKTKERSEVAGTSKKPYRQKGTGNARAGDVKSPLWRKGGTIFGPRPRQYGFKLNRKERRLARRSALSVKATEGSIRILENFEMDAPKTKQFVALLDALSLEGKTLVITAENNENLYYSGRNIPGVHFLTAQTLNTYDILNADQLLILEDAVAPIHTSLTDQ